MALDAGRRARIAIENHDPKTAQAARSERAKADAKRRGYAVDDALILFDQDQVKYSGLFGEPDTLAT